jgi:hypothetical protein
MKIAHLLRELFAYWLAVIVIVQLSGCVYAGLFPIGLAGDGKGNVSLVVGHGGGAIGAGGVAANCTATCVGSSDSEACKHAMAKAQEFCGKPTEGKK